MAITLSNQIQVRPLDGAIVRPYLAGAAVSMGDAVYLDSNSAVRKAIADDAATAEAIGLVVSGEGINDDGDFASGQTVGVVVFGPVAGFSSITEGARLYVSDATAGDLTETAPGAGSVVKEVGYPLADDIVMVMPGSKATAGS